MDMNYWGKSSSEPQFISNLYCYHELLRWDTDGPYLFAYLFGQISKTTITTLSSVQY